MATKTIEKTQTNDQSTNRVQDKLLTVINPVLRNQLLDSVIIDSEVSSAGVKSLLVSLTNTSFKNIPHKLARAYIGWFVISTNAAAVVWEDPNPPSSSANPDVKKFLRLKASAAVKVKLLVF